MKKEVILVVFTYLIVGGLWIIFSDALLAMVVPPGRTYVMAQTYKGWFFVLVTGILLYFRLEIVFSRLEEIDKIKTNFVSLVSHQLRTPLSGIKWMMELLSSQVGKEPEEKIKKNLKTVEENNERLILLVNDLLNVSRIESKGKSLNFKETILLSSILEEAVKQKAELARGLGVRMTDLTGVPKDIKVEGDRLQLEQAFINIIDNAIKYSKPNGQVKITAVKKGKSAIVKIEDDGIGMPDSLKKKLFEKFCRGENINGRVAGSGLGLFIVKGFVEKYGGKVGVESTENVGTTVTVTLPIKK